MDPSLEPVPLEETPPLPGDACPDPPSALGTFVENGVQARQDAADATRDELMGADAITVVMCGTGSPVPSDRVQACVAVFAGGRFLLFDAGDGAQRSMEDLSLPVTELDAVFLTHFHSDHMADLGEVISRSWILGRTSPLPVYGGPSVERVVEGFNLAYSPDELYRVAHHGEAVLPTCTLRAEAQRIEPPGAAGAVVYDEGGVVVRAYGVDHAPVGPSLGYRVEYGGKAVGISGDTVSTEGLRNLAQGADLLISEVIDLDFALETACALERAGDERNGAIFRDIRTYHIGVSELAELAADADVGGLVLTHTVPAAPAGQGQALFVDPMAGTFDGPVTVAEDGDRFTVALP